MRWFRSIILALCSVGTSHVFAENLLQVYQQAQLCDAQYQEAVRQRLSVNEGVPISVAALLPNISAQANPSIAHMAYSGSSVQTDPRTGNSTSPKNNTLRYYNVQLTATQTVFNFAQFAQVAGSISTAKAADATLNAAAQNLMIRVSRAYFAILQDEDNLLYCEASKTAFKEQLDEAKQQYEVGFKSITDVYTAQARYDSSISTCVTAQTNLSNDRENLRVITGKYYSHLSRLSEQFPLVSPHPVNVEVWVNKALQQNWTIKSFQYKTQSALENIRQQYAGHLPTLNVQASFQRQYSDNINGYNPYIQRNGPSVENDKQIGFNLNVPIFAGGGVVAQTNQATYDYEASQQQLEQNIRQVLNTTRQSFLNILAGISKISADKQAVTSNIHSLHGMEESYKAGTETLFDVLNQQQILLTSQTQYANDRYAFVNNVLALKQAAGTLCFDDLLAINAWLVDKEPQTVGINPLRPRHLRHPKIRPAVHKHRLPKQNTTPVPKGSRVSHRPNDSQSCPL